MSSTGGVSSALRQAQTGDAVAITVLRKALDLEAQAALQLIQSLPQIAASNPPNLGSSVNTFA